MKNKDDDDDALGANDAPVPAALLQIGEKLANDEGVSTHGSHPSVDRCFIIAPQLAPWPCPSVALTQAISQMPRDQAESLLSALRSASTMCCCSAVTV